MGMLAKVPHVPLEPLINALMAPGPGSPPMPMTSIARVNGGLGAEDGCHGRGAYARDDDGDGFQAVHVHTRAGVWSLLRSWLRPHRGRSQDHWPRYGGFFACVHQVRRSGNA